MRLGPLIGGVILLIIGFVLYAVGANAVDTVNSCLQSSLCTLGAAFDSSQVQGDYATGQTFEAIGGILAIIGFVLLIVGVIGKKKVSPVPPQQPPFQQIQPSPPMPSRFCTSCGTPLLSQAVFCSKCGNRTA